MEESIQIQTRIKARAVASEFSANARPLYLAPGVFARDRTGHIALTIDGIHPLKPLKIVHNANLVVTAGKHWLADMMIGTKTTSLAYVGVGSGNSAPLATDTDVETPVGVRKVYSDRFRTDFTITISAFFGSAEANGTWNNAGVFDSYSGGSLFCKSTFNSPVQKKQTNTQRVDLDIEIL